LVSCGVGARASIAERERGGGGAPDAGTLLLLQLRRTESLEGLVLRGTQLDGDRGEDSVLFPVLWSLIFEPCSCHYLMERERVGGASRRASSPLASADMVPAAVGSMAFGPAVCLPVVVYASWQQGRILISRTAGAWETAACSLAVPGAIG
jgi:hypothetical protein